MQEKLLSDPCFLCFIIFFFDCSTVRLFTVPVFFLPANGSIYTYLICEDARWGKEGVIYELMRMLPLYMFLVVTSPLRGSVFGLSYSNTWNIDYNNRGWKMEGVNSQHTTISQPQPSQRLEVQRRELRGWSMQNELKYKWCIICCTLLELQKSRV